MHTLVGVVAYPSHYCCVLNQQKDELTFEEGDTLYITEKVRQSLGLSCEPNPPVPSHLTMTSYASECDVTNKWPMEGWVLFTRLGFGDCCLVVSGIFIVLLLVRVRMVEGSLGRS